jgi:hypothetical protein
MSRLAQLGDIVSQLAMSRLAQLGNVAAQLGEWRLDKLWNVVAQLVGVQSGSVRGYCGSVSGCAVWLS